MPNQLTDKEIYDILEKYREENDKNIQKLPWRPWEPQEPWRNPWDYSPKFCSNCGARLFGNQNHHCYYVLPPGRPWINPWNEMDKILCIKTS